MNADLLPIFLALLAAFLFGLGAQFQHQGLAHMDSRRGATITIAASALLYVIAAPVFLDWRHLLHPAVLIFVLIGLFRPAFSGNLALAGMRYLGPTLSTTLTSTAPLFGAAFAVLWLGEALNWATATGTVAIVLAIMVLTGRGGRVVFSWPIWALALPVAAAALRSLGHVLSKVGMESIPDPYFAALVGFVVSAIVVLAMHKARRNAPAIDWFGRGARWFMGASCCFSLALLSLNYALLRGQVVQVVPVVAASPIVTLLLSVAVFRRERISSRVIIAVGLVVPGVALIAAYG